MPTQESQVKNIIFDFGGVLLEWHPDRVYRPYFNDEILLQKFYAETQIMLHNRELDRGQPFDKILKALILKFPQYSQPLMLWKNAWHKMLGGRIEGTVEMLYALQKADYRLFGLTNWAAETFPFVFYSHEFFQIFEDIVVSGRVGLIKPEIEMKKLAGRAQDLEDIKALEIIRERKKTNKKKIETTPTQGKPLQFTKEEAIFNSREDVGPIIEFLDNFQKMVDPRAQYVSQLISIKVPVPLLEAFKARANLLGIPYQSQIKKLMLEWLRKNA